MMTTRMVRLLSEHCSPATVRLPRSLNRELARHMLQLSEDQNYYYHDNDHDGYHHDSIIDDVI